MTAGVDGSPESRAAARWAAREAALHAVPLRIVHAVDLPLIPVAPRLDQVTADRWADEELTRAVQDVRGRHPGRRGRPQLRPGYETDDAALP
ncbi:hypothetical protein GPJ59_00040 [Streptomyces bambusae]|uniref:UspA domain-containing protein n=1 Tax=Streptomyces bambusae TaxID=1550616 RepID=A0ABS6YXV1_9ACTN|nr:hypothetical protein [Streptomyces bambusae]